MPNLLYYREITEEDICPDCKEILTFGVWNEKEQTVSCVCFTCGYNYEQLGWPSKHLKLPNKKEKEDEVNEMGE